MIQLALVAVGGAAGSVLRYGIGLWATRIAGPHFPWGTLAVNVVGCFFIGLLSELIARKFGGSAELRLLLITGFLGGFTTFSAFALETSALLERDAIASAIAYIAASVAVSLVAVFAGLALARSVT